MLVTLSAAHVRRDGDHRHRHREFVCRRIQQQESVHRALHQHARILLDQLFLPVVTGGEVEVMRRGQLFYHAAHHAGKVAFAQVRSQHAHAH